MQARAMKAGDKVLQALVEARTAGVMLSGARYVGHEHLQRAVWVRRRPCVQCHQAVCRLSIKEVEQSS
jgi:hypothetical protein